MIAGELSPMRGVLNRWAISGGKCSAITRVKIREVKG